MHIKKIFILSLVLCCLALFSVRAEAYLSTIPILATDDIKNLSDQALTDTYVQVLIELQSIDVQHQGSGFSPNEYKQYKDLLLYQYNLKEELKKRQLEIPRLEG